MAGAVDFVVGFLAEAPAVVFFGAVFFGAGTVAAFLAVAVVLFFVAAGFFALAVSFVAAFLTGASGFLVGAFFTTGFLTGTGFEFLKCE